MYWRTLLVSFSLLLSACSVNENLQASPVPSSSAPDDARELDIKALAENMPVVDLTLHSVPLEEIYFDTFQPVNRAVPLTQADQELIDRLLDAISPIHDPKYETGKDAGWLFDTDIVIGYATDNGAWAYPIRILNFHEIVNDYLDGTPVLVSYCPLCYSAIVYDRRLDSEVLVFGNTSALYQSDMVMVDYNTGSYWWQVAGKGIVGPLTNKTLTILPSQTTTWGEWLKAYPHTLALAQDQGFNRDYGRDPFDSLINFLNAGQFAFPVNDEVLDDRLLPADRVLAVQIGGEVHGYPIRGNGLSVRHDVIDEIKIVIFMDAAKGIATAFSPVVGAEMLTFEALDMIIDQNTQSEWNIHGQAISGDFEGSHLAAIPSKTTFWFAMIAAHPDLVLVSP